MLSCKKASLLLSKGFDEPLSLGERLSLRFHMFLCRVCRTYNKQMCFLEQAYKHYCNNVACDETPCLCEEKREEIKKKLKDKLGCGC